MLCALADGLYPWVARHILRARYTAAAANAALAHHNLILDAWEGYS